MHTARHRAFGLMHAKEFADLAQNGIERPRFVARRRLDRVAMHRIADPDHIGPLFAHRVDQARQVFADRACAKARDQGQAARLILGVQLGHQQFEVLTRHGGAAFQANGVLNTAGELHMGTIRLTGPVADPDHVTRAGQPFARSRIQSRQRLFIFQQQRLVAGVEFNRRKLVRCVGVNAGGCHEIDGVLNARGNLAVFFRPVAFGKPKRPRMDHVHVGIATGRKGAQQVQRGRCLGVGLQHLGRIGNPRLGRKGQLVDDVTTVAGQFQTIHRFGRSRTRLGKLTRHAAQLDHRNLSPIGQDHRHLQHDLEGVANAIRAELLKALGAIATLQQERVAPARIGQMCLEPAGLTRKNQRWIVRELRLDRVQGRCVRIIGHLYPGLGAPVRFCPIAHRLSPQNVSDPMIAASLYKRQAWVTISQMRPLDVGFGPCSRFFAGKNTWHAEPCR
mmetsp:Transcript_27758/g.51683  ORF Transcript_27758/g.51683 Transcript_27758/m.51683 type:complete len:447 (+) Transcript_27758:1034-2374(+)